MISCLTLLALPVHPLPGPPCSPNFHVPDPGFLDRSSHLAKDLCHGCFSTGFPARRRVPVGLERSAAPRSVFERALEMGRPQVCRDALDLCCAPGANQGARSSEQDPSKSPPNPGENLIYFPVTSQLFPSHFPVSSSRAASSGGMPVCNVLSLSQKRVVWLRLCQDCLQAGWDAFPGAEVENIPSPMAVRGDGRLLCPTGNPQSWQGFLHPRWVFQSEVFMLVSLRCRGWPRSSLLGVSPLQSILSVGISVRPCWVRPWAPGISKAEG